MDSKPSQFPEQQQKKQPGREHKMTPEPEIIRDGYRGSGKLDGKVVLITGGDSGIGRAVAVHFAREGAKIAVVYLEENEDAKKTKSMVEQEGTDCLLLAGDLREEQFCREAVNKTVKAFGGLDILVNNAGEQHPRNSLEEISSEQLLHTYETNIFAQFHCTKAALKVMPDNGAIVNTTSVTTFRGSSHLIDYASTKGAILGFTRSLSKNLAERGIRVNAVAPGPIWTPLIPATFDEVAEFGQDTPLGRAGQPSEVAPAYVYLASADSSYVTGQVIHVNGGEFLG